jgi:hypothetical protein
MDNALPEDGVTAPKHVSYFNVNFNIVFKTIVHSMVSK